MDYYTGQIDNILPADTYGVSIKIRSTRGETHWMEFNSDSFEAITKNFDELNHGNELRKEEELSQKVLTFTTTEPGFMGLDGSDTLVPLKADRKVIGKWQQLYIHGEAQYECGYDIPTIVEGLLKFFPEQDCLVALKDKKIECILVAWEVKGIYRGLICAKTDKEGLAYARKCSKDKRTIL